MMVNISIPPALKAFADGRDHVELVGATVGELMTELTRKFPSLRDHLYDENDSLRTFLNIYLNDEDIRYLGRERAKVQEGDVVLIIPAVAGG